MIVMMIKDRQIIIITTFMMMTMMMMMIGQITCIPVTNQAKGNFSNKVDPRTGNYLNNASEDLWLNKAGFFKVTFDYLDLERCCDRLLLLDGSGRSLFQIKYILNSDKQLPSFGVWLKSPVLLRFQSDSSVTRKGFLLRYENKVADKILTASSGEISSTINPETNNYYNLADERWLIDTNSTVQIVFSNLDLAKDDHVRIFEKSRSIDVHKMRFALRDKLDARCEYWLQGPVTIQFASDLNLTSTGFTLQYVLHDSNSAPYKLATQVIRSNVKLGIFSHPTYSNLNYSSNYTKAWAFVAKENQGIKLDFFAFKTHSPEDRIEIYQGVGSQMSSNSIFKFWGSIKDMKPSSVTVMGSCTLVFRTNHKDGDEGFGLVYGFSNNFTLSSNKGTIQSLTDPDTGNYSNNANDRWLINISNTHVQISFHDSFDIEECCDYIFISDSHNSPQLREKTFLIRNKLEAQSEFILKSPVMIQFISNHNQTGKGFQINYRVNNFLDTDTPTQVIKDFQLGVITSHPYFQHKNYPNNFSKKWLFEASANRGVRLRFLNFSTELDKDLLKIFSVSPSDIEHARPVLEISGKRGDSLRDKTYDYFRPIRILFNSNSNVTDTGFAIQFSQINRMTLNNESGTISSFTQPKTSNYFNVADDIWEISAQKRLHLKVLHLDTESCCDGILLYDSSGSNISQVEDQSKAIFVAKNRDDTNAEFYLQGPVKVQFISDSSITGTGFTIQYSPTASDENDKTNPASTSSSTSVPLQIITKPTAGVIHSHHNFKNSSFPPNSVRAWSLVMRPHQKLMLQFLKFDRFSNNDHLQVFEGIWPHIQPQPSFELRGNYDRSERDLPHTRFLYASNLTILFKSGPQLAIGKGMIFSYKVTTDSILTAKSGTIMSNSHWMTSKYVNGANTSWLIDVASPIRLRFTEFSLDDCCDKVYLQDTRYGDSVPKRLRYVLKRKDDVADEFWLQGPVRVTFTSDATVAGEGFRLQYFALTNDNQQIANENHQIPPAYNLIHKLDLKLLNKFATNQFENIVNGNQFAVKTSGVKLTNDGVRIVRNSKVVIHDKTGYGFASFLRNRKPFSIFVQLHQSRQFRENESLITFANNALTECGLSFGKLNRDRDGDDGFQLFTKFTNLHHQSRTLQMSKVDRSIAASLTKDSQLPNSFGFTFDGTRVTKFFVNGDSVGVELVRNQRLKLKGRRIGYDFNKLFLGPAATDAATAGCDLGGKVSGTFTCLAISDRQLNVNEFTELSDWCLN